MTTGVTSAPLVRSGKNPVLAYSADDQPFEIMHVL